jgi:hypothetical protein
MANESIANESIDNVSTAIVAIESIVMESSAGVIEMEGVSVAGSIAELSSGDEESGCFSCRTATGTAAETPAVATIALTNKKGVYR